MSHNIRQYFILLRFFHKPFIIFHFFSSGHIHLYCILSFSFIFKYGMKFNKSCLKNLVSWPPHCRAVHLSSADWIYLHKTGFKENRNLVTSSSGMERQWCIWTLIYLRRNFTPFLLPFHAWATSLIGKYLRLSIPSLYFKAENNNLNIAKIQKNVLLSKFWNLEVFIVVVNDAEVV